MTTILAFCQKKIPSAIIGVIKPMEYVAAHFGVRFIFEETLKVSEQQLYESDVVVCIRGSDPTDLELVEASRKLGKYVIYYLDDDLLNLTTMSNSYHIFNNEYTKKIIRKIMDGCNCFWTNNPNLQSKYGAYFAKSFVADAPALLFDEKKLLNHGSKLGLSKIKIGFAGSGDHKFFVDEFLYEPLLKLKKKYGDLIDIEFVGVKPKFSDEINIRVRAYINNHTDYVQFMHNLDWDIALAPLPKSEYHSCKYFNKFLEYSAIGAVGVYSNVEPYTFIIKNGENGFLADNHADEWVQIISNIVENPEIMRSIAQNSHQLLKNRFTASAIGKSLVEKCPEIIYYSSPSTSKLRISFSKKRKNYWYHKLRLYFKIFGLRAPWYIFKKILKK